MPKSTQWTGWTPPDPASLDAGSRDGQRLLALIKSMEKENDDIAFSNKFEETLLLTKNLISIYARHGLLRGNYQKAEEIMASNGGDNSNRHQGGTSKSNKRSRRKEDKKSEDKSLIESVSTDESLLMSALLRIFGLQGEKLHSMMPLVTLAADVCTSISNNLKSIPNLQSSTIGLAEYELIASSGVPLLRGLSKMISSLLFSICQSEDATKKIQIHLDTSLDDMDEISVTLHSCLRASAALVSLFGTKISRSTGLLSDLQNIAWSALTLPHEGIQSASARLLATLPLAGAASNGAGGRNNHPTSILTTAEQWSNSLTGAVAALSTMLKTLAPVSQKMTSKDQSFALTGCIGTVLEATTAFFHKNLGSDETTRLSTFRFLINGFSTFIVALLSRDYNGPKNKVSLLDARLCMDDILNLLETMLSFPAASESLFYITKKRLRQENVEGGVLSPSALASELANYIKLSGHRVLNTLFNAVGSPVLVPHAKRIQRMVSAVLFTSCSGPLRKVLDAVSTSQLEGTKRRWLHTSIFMRSESIRTFSEAISLFGLEPTRISVGGSSWVPSKKSSNMEQCITLVGGCLVEQLTWEGGDTEDWGSPAERSKLAVTAAKSLEASLLSCGGFMSLATRALIDSICTTGLQVIVSHHNNLLGSSSQVKVAILELGSACLTTPWPNGAASSLLEQVQITAAKCTLENSVVSAVAATTLRLCDSLASPRVPALHTVTKKQDITSSKVPLSSDALIQGINSAQELISRQREDVKREAQEEAEQKKKRMKVSEKTSSPPETQPQAAPDKSTGASSTEHAAKAIVAPLLLDNEDKKTAKLGTSSDKISIQEEADAHMEESKENGEKAAGDEDEFLPGIIDDDGPDEEDV